MSIAKTTLQILVVSFFKVYFSTFGKPHISKTMRNTLALYNKGNFQDFFQVIRIWDAPFETINKHVPNKGIILDLGSGDGLLLNYLALNSPNRRLFGYEINRERLEVSSRGIVNTKFEHADLTKLTFPKADCILLVHVLHHLSTKAMQERLLENCLKSMNKNSKLVIVEIAEKPFIKYLITWVTDAFVVPMLFEKKLFSKDFYYRKVHEWQILLKGKGFKVSTEYTSTGKPFSHVLLIATKK